MIIKDLSVLLLGFPKAGTTSFASWLDSFDEIVVSSPKETFCLTPEFVANYKRAGSLTLSQAFPQDVRGKLLVEASTMNVYSGRLFETLASTACKVIFVVRDPVLLVQSWHEQMVFAGDAFSPSLTESWEHGLSLEANPPADLRRCYSVMFRQAEWIKKWKSQLGADRVLIVQNKLLADSNKLTSTINEFLSTNLPVSHEVPRSNVRLNRNVHWLRYLRAPVVRKLLRVIDQQGKLEEQIKSITRQLFVTKDGREMSATLKKHIESAFSDDKLALADLLVDQSSHEMPYGRSQRE